jgi:hypothetical protein
MHDSVHQDDIAQRVKAALDRFIAGHRLPQPLWAHIYGLRLGARMQWLSVHLRCTDHAYAWAAALGTQPTAGAWLDSDSRLRCRVHVARMMTLPDCPVPVDVAYVLDVDAIQAVAL